MIFYQILSIGNCTLSCHVNAFTHKCFHHTLTLAPLLKKYRFLVNLVFLPILIMGNCTLSCHSIAFTLMLSHVFYTQWFPHPTSYSFIHELLIGFLFRYIYLLHNITFMTLHLSMSLTSCYSINFIYLWFMQHHTRNLPGCDVPLFQLFIPIFNTPISE